jgi:hypothetical protein
MKLCLLLAVILISQLVFAQLPENSNLYLKAGGIIGNYYGADISLEYVNNNEQSFSIGAYIQNRKAPDIPEDYISPLGIVGKIFFWGLDLDYPQVEVTTFYLSTGKILKSNTDKIRFDLSGGVGFNYINTPTGFIKKEPQESMENYSYTYEKGYSFGLIINPSVDFAVWKYFGFSAGITSMITRDRFTCGLEIAYLIGLVNHK